MGEAALPLRLGLLASHGGTNLQAVLDACREGRLEAQAAVVISNNSDALALQRARLAGVSCAHLSGRTHPDPDLLDRAICDTLVRHRVDLVVLVGYMKKLGPHALDRYRGRILNIHPALLPKYGGPGMYGDHVHEAVLASGDHVTGATVHLVDERYDHGPIIVQREVTVLPDDTVASLRERVLAVEHDLLVETLQRIARGEISLGECAARASIGRRGHVP
jgi:phosphoribosylglycinamide formyltransferase-1